MTDNLVTVRVWGDFACFTRPEMKVERVSYPVMTPSAARGILEAIFWEPQMYGSLVIPGIHNSMIFRANKECPYKSSWIL
jgi:CRISPR-associated protein Cas5d